MMKGIRAEKICSHDYYSFCSHQSGYFDVTPQTGWVLSPIELSGTVLGTILASLIGYYENAQKKGSIFVYQISSTVQFDKTLT